MNWFERNRWLGVFLIIFGLAALAALVFLFSAKSHSDEALGRFQQAIGEKNRLERLDPFPSEANYRKMKLHLENYAASLDKLKQELKTRVPDPPPLAPNEFQGRLRQAMLAVAERARLNRVKLPANFALGFEEYTTALPATNVAPLLGQELSQIELLMNYLIDAHVDGISKVARKPLSDERGATTAASPAPMPSPPPRPGATVAGGTQLVERGMVDVTFTSAPNAARKVLNEVISAPQQFYLVRLLHVRNEKGKGPPREQAGQPGAAATPAQPTPAQAAPGKTPSVAALNFIVGNEHIETSASIELVRFTF